MTLKSGLSMALIVLLSSMFLSLQSGEASALSVNSGSPSLSLNASLSPGLTQALNTTKNSWPWYVTRAAGLLAAVLLGLLILFGIGLVTGHTYRLMEPRTAWSVHRALALSLGVVIIVHVGVLLFDKFAPFSIFQVLIPFVSHYKPVTIGGLHLGSLYVACGVIAFYVAGTIILSSLFWMEKKPGTWRALHYLGYLLMVFVFIHGLYLGTDLMHGLLKTLWLLGGAILVSGAAARAWRMRTISKDDA